ncbi:protein NETWORKED 4A-like [Bidens hawaiensis]|uniref:protein NETWORKED 4A-like n=1 Tax=Bidens hawaiensis TaxID=980011 RepID=UPI0040490410
MTSSLTKGYKRMESRNKHSWWWDSHISSKNSKWLAENIEEMDESVKRMLKLIEEDGDSLAKKAEMYYQKRPQLISHVEEFYRMYRSLAERYDNITGELKKNIPSDLQSTRPVGLKSGTDLVSIGDDTSTLDSESESDDSSVNNYSGNRGLIIRITELESENEKLKAELQKYELLMAPVAAQSDDVNVKEEDKENGALEDELKIIREKLNVSEEEVKRLRTELGSSNQAKEITSLKSKLDKEKREVLKIQERVTRYKTNLSDRDREIRAMRETLSNANKTLSEENTCLQEQVTKLLKEQVLLNNTIKECDLRCQISDEELRRIKVLNTDLETEIEKLKFENNELVVKVNELEHALTIKDGQIDDLGRHLDQLHLEHVELVDRVEKSNKSIEELEKEVASQQEVIKEQAEEKREVIRQLCFSLEHYRDGYQMMRQAFVGHNKRHTVMAS